MTELEILREWLSGQAVKRQLNSIAAQTGVNRRTIQRIVNNDGYTVNLTTYSKLKAQMEKEPTEQAATA